MDMISKMTGCQESVNEFQIALIYKKVLRLKEVLLEQNHVEGEVLKS